MELLELVAKAITSAVSSGRKLSWKIQDNQRGTLVQLVWKNDSVTAGDPSGGVEEATIGVAAPAVDSARRPGGVSGMQTPRRNIPPSRKRRNARRLQDLISTETTQSVGQRC